LVLKHGDPTLGFKKDFEGYLVYRSTEPEFNDIKTITDSKGAPKFWKPIAQFDLKMELLVLILLVLMVLTFTEVMIPDFSILM
jgi:hypothetical protein